MSLTAEEIQARKSRIGASDVAAILGMPTFKGRNAYTTWLEKTDQLEPEKQSAEWLDAGNDLEPVILDRAERSLGTKIQRKVVVADPVEGSHIVSMLDGQVVINGRPVEGKTTGIFGPIMGQWGEEHTDDVPLGYIAQCQTQLLCTGADLCHLFALVGSRGFIEYHIEPSDKLFKLIRSVSNDFFDGYVLKGKDPRTDWADRLQNVHGVNVLSDPCEPVLEYAKRFRKQPGKTIQVADCEAFDAWDEIRAQRLETEKAEKVKLAECLAIAGDAECVELPDGRCFTNMEQKGADLIDREAMKAEGIYDDFAKPNRYRVARIRKAK